MNIRAKKPKANMRSRNIGWYLLHVALASMVVRTPAARAQLGSGWVQYQPEQKIHLVDFQLPTRKGMVSLDWTNHAEVGSNSPASSYDYDAKTGTETFKLHDQRANRSEIRLLNDYGTGSRQFEGYVTFYPPLNDESLMQIWGSDLGATQLMLRGYAAEGGALRIANHAVQPVFAARLSSSDKSLVATNCYGREIKVNIIHLQKDVGDKFIVYLDNQRVFEFPDHQQKKNNNGKNYHKYGCYGTLRTDGAIVKWRAVKHFKDGIAPVEPATTDVRKQAS